MRYARCPAGGWIANIGSINDDIGVVSIWRGREDRSIKAHIRVLDGEIRANVSEKSSIHELGNDIRSRVDLFSYC